MSTKQLLIREIEALPPQIIDEIFTFVNFLKVKKVAESDAGNIHFASESVLAKDWLLPEEDAAWASL